VLITSANEKDSMTMVSLCPSTPSITFAERILVLSILHYFSTLIEKSIRNAI